MVVLKIDSGTSVSFASSLAMLGNMSTGEGYFLSASLPLEMCCTVVTCALFMLYMYSSGMLYIFM